MRTLDLSHAYLLALSVMLRFAGRFVSASQIAYLQKARQPIRQKSTRVRQRSEAKGAVGPAHIGKRFRDPYIPTKRQRLVDRGLIVSYMSGRCCGAVKTCELRK